MNRLAGWWNSQWITWGQVKPEVKWIGKEVAFHFQSPAGHIVIKPRDAREIPVFRDKYVNWFGRIEKGAAIRFGWLKFRGERAFFALFAVMEWDQYQGTYRSNLRVLLRFMGYLLLVQVLPEPKIED